MNKRTRQIVAATATLLILVILQSISLPNQGGAVHVWHPSTEKAAQHETILMPERSRHANGIADLRARPTR